jgi:hypothetical protein
MFIYNTSADAFEEDYESWDSSLNESDIDLEFSFQNTPNGEIDHRVYEFRINRTSLSGIGENFSIAFLGYGTMATTILDTIDWGAPTYFDAILFDSNAIFEDSYFKCGPDRYDVNTIPS